MKKALLLVFIVLFIFTIVACDNNTIQPEEDPPLTEPNADSSLIKFGYSDLVLDFAWDIWWCHIMFTITGDTSNVAGVFISGHTSGSEFSNDEIIDMAKWASFEHLELSDGRYDGQSNDGHISDGFQIEDIGSGNSGQILFFVIDTNRDIIGYVIIPVTVPAS